MEKNTNAKVAAAEKAKEKKPVTKVKPAPEKKAAVVDEKAAVNVQAESKTASPVVQPTKVEPIVEHVKVERKAEPKKNDASVKESVVEKVAAEQSAPDKKKTIASRSGTQPLVHTVGRRKTAIARVFFRRGTGKIVVNGESYVNYFNTDIMRLDASIPFRVCPVGSHYDVSATVNGGGIGAQAGAVRLGISRALVELHEETRPTLRQFGLLTVDSRRKERKKYGQKAARRKFQFVKR